MKIIEITYKLSSGGAERFVVDLSNQLVKTNEVSLITIKNDDHRSLFYENELSEKIRFLKLNIPPGYSLNSLFRLYRIIKKEKPDVVHFHVANIVVYFLLPILFYRNCKYFETQHNDANFDVRKGSVFFYIRQFLYKTKLVKTCAISDYNKKTIEEVFEIEEIPVIVNGREKTMISDKFESVKNEIDQFKSSNNTICFVHIGRCTAQKNQKLLIESFNNFNLSSDAILLVIGSGFDDSIGYELKKISNKNVHFLGERNNIFDYLTIADGFCLSSIYEGMPITLIESFSAGCIPISTPVSGCLDYIIDGITGFLAKDFTTDSYIEALCRFKENRKQISQNALYSCFIQNFDIHTCSDKYLNWFKESL